MKWFFKWVNQARKDCKAKRKNRIRGADQIVGLKDQEAKQDDECNSYKKGRWQEDSVTINFPVWANIGFVPQKPEFLRLNMSFDTQLLDYIREKKEALASIRLEDDSVQSEELICMTQIVEVGLKGLLIGNITISIFKPLENTVIQHEHYATQTAFCKTQSIPIDLILGIRCLQCESAPIPKHEIYIKVNNPYLIKPDGERVYAYEKEVLADAPLNENFVKQFDGETMRLIYFPLTIGVDFEHIVVQLLSFEDYAWKGALPPSETIIQTSLINEDFVILSHQTDA